MIANGIECNNMERVEMGESPGNVVMVVTRQVLRAIRQRSIWNPYFLDLTPRQCVLASRKSA